MRLIREQLVDIRVRGSNIQHHARTQRVYDGSR